MRRARPQFKFDRTDYRIKRPRECNVKCARILYIRAKVIKPTGLAAVGSGADNHIFRLSTHRSSPSGSQKNDTIANGRPPVIDHVFRYRAVSAVGNIGYQGAGGDTVKLVSAADGLTTLVPPWPSLDVTNVDAM